MEMSGMPSVVVDQEVPPFVVDHTPPPAAAA
jgi:hypothetical protein